LKSSSLRARCTKATTCCAEPLAGAGGLAPDDLELARRVRVVDPGVQAAALERVVDLAGAVRRDDDDRRMRGADRADLGHRELQLGEHFEQEGLEGLVGPVELVDEQHRRLRLRERLQQRALEQHLARIQLAHERIASGLVAGFGHTDLEHLPRDVPFVGGRGDVQALVALQADQGRPQRARQHLGQLGLADAGFAFEQQRPAQAQGEKDGRGQCAAGEVVLAGQQGQGFIDVVGSGHVVGIRVSGSRFPRPDLSARAPAQRRAGPSR